jgi:hypothetical protein
MGRSWEGDHRGSRCKLDKTSDTPEEVQPEIDHLNMILHVDIMKYAPLRARTTCCDSQTIKVSNRWQMNSLNYGTILIVPLLLKSVWALMSTV